MTANAYTHRLPAVTLVALLAVLVLASRAGAAEKAIWGPARLPDGQSAFPLYEQLGIDTYEVSIGWNEIAPTRPSAARDPGDPAYRWPPGLDAVIASARGRRIAVALLVQRAPGWANGGQAPIWAPGDPRDFGDFLVAAAHRYPAVRRWMIWSEPNKDTNFRPNRENDPVSARTYAPLLDAAYAALKGVNPGNRVIGGMTWTGGTVKPGDFVRWMRLPDGRPPRLDWFGHNPFPFRFPALANQPVDGYRDLSDLDTLGREVDRAYGRSSADPVPLWLSEYTIQTDHASHTFALFTSEQGQASYVRAGYRIADGLGARVAGLGWLGLLDEAPAPDSANVGLMTYGLRRKLSFDALARAPSRRASPLVALAPYVSRSALRARGIAVTLTPRSAGRIGVELRCGGRLLAASGVRARIGRASVVRLRHRVARGGACTIVVRSPRGATVRRSLRIG